LKEPAPIIDKYGNQRWRNKDGQLHRDNDMPAVITKSGGKYWYINGEQHRDNDLPAVIFADGTKYWYKNGELIKSARSHTKNNL